MGDDERGKHGTGSATQSRSYTRTDEERKTSDLTNGLSDELLYVGGSYPVHDAPLKVTGELIFGSDLSMPGMLHAKLILSPIPHGIVKQIDAARALKLPGVVGIFSHENAPMEGFSRARIHPGQDLCFYDETLFSKHVRFVGDRVAAVLATSKETAQAAASLVEVEYEELPPLLTVSAALAPEAPLIHETGNLLHKHEVENGERPDFDEAVVISSTTTTPRIHHSALEPHVCVAQAHCDGTLTVWTTSQGVYAARTVIAELLHIDYHRVRVVKVPTGGSFGGKTEYVIEPVCASRSRNGPSCQATSEPGGVHTSHHGASGDDNYYTHRLYHRG